ncbi:MAG: hypothetical protein KatS3mg105_0773 [Gemmatales bacterium]|nr:MAG: hypothetical protein KatS3mg105_0773 [Gemmatales bacterium]
MQLLQFFFDIAGNSRIADIGIDLAPRCYADAHRFEPLLQVHLVGRNDHSPSCRLLANDFGFEVFPFGNVFHFVCDLAFAGRFKLGHLDLLMILDLGH